MKKNRIILFAVAICALSLYFFCGLPADEQEQIVPEEKVEVVDQTPVPTQTPVAIEENNKAQETEPEENDAEPDETEHEEIEPSPDVISETKELSCTLLVRCDSVINNIEMLSETKRKIIPDDGIIYPEQTVIFQDGESVFDVLLREMRANKIHLEFVDTPMYDSVYIEGIGNLYEFDCGDLSGWQYSVNGEKPLYGCSQYKLNNGDTVVFYYSTNFLDE